MIATSWRRRELAVGTAIPRERRPVIVAFQGERGAYGDLAIEARWGSGALRVRCWDFEGVASVVSRGGADFGILPLHNAIIGEIPGTREVIDAASLLVHDEITVPVRHCLLGIHGATLQSLRDVFSHPAALEQCTSFFLAHASLHAREGYDTAGSAREVAARRRPWEGAIASEACAARYGLRVIAPDIGDREDNATRFAIVSRQPSEEE
jgi:prephenate dehydratase